MRCLQSCVISVVSLSGDSEIESNGREQRFRCLRLELVSHITCSQSTPLPFLST